MPKLDEHQIDQIVKLLRAGENLPPDYRNLLFPVPQTAEITLPGNNGRLSGKILVVDDNEHNQDLLRDHLEWQGHTVETAGDGKQALEMMQSTDYDLVLLDIMMPIMDGYEVLEHLFHDPILRHLPVIVISALSDMSSIVRCVEMGAEDYLFKPFDAVLLRARIAASLEKKRLRDQEQIYLMMLEDERAKSERLILNILPAPIAERLKQDDTTIADHYPAVTVLFADIVDFTSISAGVPPAEIVDMLNQIFSVFDNLADNLCLEKIKTIGDAYMVVGGLPVPCDNHIEAVANMALNMQEQMAILRESTGIPFSLRIGINTGPVVAGVIGTRKFIYDLWGDTVNTASRMEETSLPGHIQTTVTVFDKLQDMFIFKERGMVSVKGKGPTLTYFLTGKAG